jgi:hypothetical protein
VAGRVIRTTAEHPFWVVGKDWLPANRLAPGDLLLTPEGEQVAVEQVAQTSQYERVYNLRIAEFQTYFVGCDEWGFSVWAHNDCVVKGGLGPPKGLYNPYNKGWKIDTFDYNGVELTGTSAQSAPGLTVEELSRYVPNPQVRVTTTEAIVAAGGTIVPTPYPDKNLPYHVTITGLTLEQLDALFARPITNPG